MPTPGNQRHIAEGLSRHLANAERLTAILRDELDQFASASILKGGRVVFNIGGNKYRLVVWINYAFFTIDIRFVGTHKQYDAINAQTI